MILRSSFCALVLFGTTLLRAQTMVMRSNKPPRNEAAVEAIVVPSSEARYAAFNPAVQEPRIVIRNNGTDPLVALSIRYGTDGFLPRMFAWNGYIAPGASAEVKLPNVIDMNVGDNTFTVVLGDPNGRKDRNPANNTLSGAFRSADVLPTRANVTLRTDGRAGGRLQLISTRGPVVLDKRWSRSDTASYQSMEVEMKPGSYVLTLTDSTGDHHSTSRLFATEDIRMCTLVGGTTSAYEFKTEANAIAGASKSDDVSLMVLKGRGHILLDVFSPSGVDLAMRSQQEHGMTYAVQNGIGEVVTTGVLPRRSAPYAQHMDLSAQPDGRYRAIVELQGREVLNGTFVIGAP